MRFWDCVAGRAGPQDPLDHVRFVVSCEPAGTDQHIVVGPDDVVAFCDIHSAVSGTREPMFSLKFASNWQPLGKGLDDVVGMVVAVVVDDHEFPIETIRYLHR